MNYVSIKPAPLTDEKGEKTAMNFMLLTVYTSDMVQLIGVHYIQ